MSNPKTIYLSLGSNLGNKMYNLQSAVFKISESIGKVLAISNVYESVSWGFESDDFLNICIAIKSNLSPTEVLKEIHTIEQNLGRIRGEVINGYLPRSIDIDILYYDYEIIDTETLTIPHPTLQERLFVLKPLSDIAPQFYHPILNKDTRNLIQMSRDKSGVKRTSFRIYKTRELLLSKLNFIAIEGNIGAGKTTLAEKISEDFNAKLILERFADNPFLPKFYKDPVRFAFPLEMSFLAERYQQFSDDTSQFDLFKSFMVGDYDIFKSLIFAKVTLQEDEFKIYRKVFNFMHKEVKKPGLYVYLYQNTERLLENIKKRDREYEQNIPPDYLEKINRGYLDFIKSAPDHNTLIIDISNLDFVKNSEDYCIILDKIIKHTLSVKN
ncbi:2-amino-4-hydroxy-6-hydroxymethyldihydropteridine diphosphokinase [Cellulophaga baltica]|uniref:2-amino-4-hydroxy-6- hydroxymethyldihydropteridine diphosphokinase n=1 Tax=Cellulophaga TaxID=104264 RepID=UPI001C06A979|nr:MULTISPECIES: 2-amino-4-hydroxy-6-hydroxymethyldihydropteridine diphosphokinase [Cellulophaga]MBU2995170.1 2-amino-4-hydroxy-6-hydroxymethyldihydropteridine diphosphokinase [Cellulophaga baltica]MDO6766565.1 2-amino-4-hydroxy-6-hydroxymethyldihydropteridine diphosphokinase [Cellulophaga sp. 1_MG-2023]